MEVYSLASSSGGNSFLVSCSGGDFLVDAGVSMKYILACLEKLGKTMKDIRGIFITHEHSDHIKGLKMIEKYYRTSIFAPVCVASGIRRAVPETEGNIITFTPGDRVDIGGISFTSFNTPHDVQCVGYKVEDRGERLGLATDIGSITPEVSENLMGSHGVILEANYDVEMLHQGNYPPYLKRRIVSPQGHLSNDDSGKMVAQLLKSGTKRIVLAHLSKENNTPKVAYRTVLKAAEEGGVSLEEGQIGVAPRAEMLLAYRSR